MSTATSFCLGLSFRTAPVAVRERAVFEGARARGLLYAAGFDAAIRGIVVLSTCGRTELYVDVRGDVAVARARLERLLAEATDLPASRLAPHLYAHEGRAAAHHLCRVAAGLDSAVPGEPEILGQVADAWRTARAAGSTSARLSRLFEAAVRSGRRARRETGINRQATGLAAVPVRVAVEHFGSLADRHVMVLGGGRMGQSTLRALEKHPVGRLTIASRRIETALALADRHGAHACCLDGFRALLPEADVVITATAAPAPIIDRELVEGALARRPQRSLFIADLGLPRNVDAGVASVAGVTLHDLDALKQRVDGAIEARRREIPRVESIIAEELTLLGKRERQAQARPAVRALRRASDRLRREAIEESLAHLPALDEVTRKHLDSVTRRVVDRVLRRPTAAVLAAAETGDASQLVVALETLFGLEAVERAHQDVDAPATDDVPTFVIAPLP